MEQDWKEEADHPQVLSHSQIHQLQEADSSLKLGGMQSQGKQNFIDVGKG